MSISLLHGLPGRRSRISPAQKQLVEDARKDRGHLADARHRQIQRRAAVHELGESLVSLAGVLGTEVKDPHGKVVGSLKDVVVRWKRGENHPPVTAVVLRVGRTELLVDARAVTAEGIPPTSVALTTPRLQVRAVERRPGDVALAHDVLDHQIVDANGLEVVRPADVYLATVDGQLTLVGVEIGLRALLRRLGPARMRRRARPDVAIDWAAVTSFAPVRREKGTAVRARAGLAGQVGAEMQLDTDATQIRRLRPEEIAQALGDSESASPEESR